MRRGKGLARVSKKRRAMQKDYDLVVDLVFRRAQHRCEVTFGGWQCRAPAKDPHHTKKPRLSFHTPEYVVALCRKHHEQAEGRYTDGRLVVTPLGNGTFAFHIRIAASKFEARG